MGPKTRKDLTPGSNAKTKEERLEQLQADHELFLQAFESKWTPPIFGQNKDRFFIRLRFCQAFCILFSNLSMIIFQNLHRYIATYDRATNYR